MELKQLHLPALIITALLSLLDGAGVVNTVLVKQGGSATLKCPLTLPVEGSSAPMQVVEWVRQGYDIPILIKFGAHSLRVHPKYEGRVSLFGSTSLKMKGLVLEDNGWYECRILQLDKSSDEGRNGTWTLLSVTAPPVFSETPPPVTEALLGKPVTLKCVARGNPLPTIKWYKDGVQIIQSNGVTVVNGSLIFKSASRSTAGQYQCRASNSEGNEIHIMQLRVKGSPVILNPPTDTVLNMSQNALLRCKAEADPPNMTYVWMKGEENVYHTESMKSRVKVMVDGTLLISHLIPGDSGNYTCMPTNGLPSPPTASAVLTVRHPAQVTKMPKRIFLPTGLRGVISCPLVAEPPLLRVEWTKNGKPLDPNAYPGWSLTADGSIIITTANDDVVGVYTCTPYNSYGTMGQSERTMVLLQDPPSLRIAPDKEYREEAGTALFIPCRASGDPQPTVTWTKFGPSVSISDYSVSVDGSLLLSPLSKEHHGEWECSVTNGVSSITTTTSVTVLGTSPHAVSSVSVEVGANQANVSWVPGFDGGYAQTFTVWLKCVCTEDEHQEWRLFPNSTSSTSLLVTGLLPSTKYQFNVMAQNKLGSGPYSEHTTATTMDPTPTPFRLEPPTQLSVNQSSEVLYLRWMVPSPEESPVDGFILQSRQEEGKWSNLDEDISVDKSEVLVQGLQKNCNYELRLLSRRGEQLSVPSRSINVSTLVAVLDGLSPGFRLPENVPLPLWIGVMAGMGVLCFILLLALVTVCLIGRRRIWRRRKTQDDHPDANMKNDSAPDSPDSVLKEKLLPLRPLSSSSSSSDHSCLDRSSQNDGQREHLLPRTHAPSHGSVCENHLRRSSTMDVIHRGPDGRFVLESQEEDSAELQDIPQSSKPVSNATLRKSQSLRSYRSDRRDPPFVVSVDMPPCGLDISASGRTRTLPNRGCYSVSLGQEISDRSSFCSEISGSVLYAPSDTYSTIKCGGPNVRASTLVLQMEHEREQGNLSRCLRLAREREELEQELRKYALDRDLSANFAKRGGSLRVERRMDINEDEKPSWNSRGTLSVSQLSSRGLSRSVSPRARPSSCIPWETGHKLSTNNLLQAHINHERSGELSHPRQISNNRRSKSLERGMHLKSLAFDRDQRRTMTKGPSMNFEVDSFYHRLERPPYSVEGSLRNSPAFNHSQEHIAPGAGHFRENQQNRMEERGRGHAGIAKDFMEMSVDELEEQALTRSMLDTDTTDRHRPSLYQPEREGQTEINVGYKTIQRGVRRDPNRLSCRSSSTLPSKQRQKPSLQKSLSVSSQHVNHHRSVPNLNSKRYKESFLPPDAWIDSLSVGQRPSLSPIQSRPGSIAEDTQVISNQETESGVPSEIQLQDSQHRPTSNIPSPPDQNSYQQMVSQHPGPPPMPVEDSSWPSYHCYSPEPEGSCRSYASQSSGRGSLDQPIRRQSMSFSPLLINSIDIADERSRDAAGLPECFRRDSVDENYEWDSQSVSMPSNDLKSSGNTVCLEDILSKGRQRSTPIDHRLALNHEKKGLYPSVSMLPHSCDESILAQEIQHGSTCYPDPEAEGVLF